MNEKRYEELMDKVRRGRRLTDEELTELARYIIELRNLEDVQDDQQRHRKGG